MPLYYIIEILSRKAIEVIIGYSLKFIVRPMLLLSFAREQSVIQKTMEHGVIDVWEIEVISDQERGSA